MNLMLINVSTRKFGRAVRLPGGDVPASKGDGRSKSAVSRRFVALSADHMAEWMASDISSLDLLAIQIDGIHINEELLLVAAVGSTRRGASIRLARSRAPPKVLPPSRRCSTIWLGAAWTRRSAACSSSTAPRR